MTLSSFQIDNLNKLSDYLWAGVFPEETRFNMDRYCAAGKDYEPTCGSVGCAIGHGPYAGVAKQDEETFGIYGDRCFGCKNISIWSWCFDMEWVDKDNTPRGAAKRIQWMLEHGVPNDSNLQLLGSPLCYADWTPPRYSEPTK